jgi:hypothetical protein
MSWSYSGNPSTSDKDAVRYLSGDTDTTDQLATDEEILWVLTQYPDVYTAAAIVCESIAAKLGTQVDKSIGSLSVSASQRAAAFRKQATTLRLNSNASAEVFVGGLSISAKQTLNEDTDAVQPSFRFNQDDNYRSTNERESSTLQDQGK